MAKCRECQQEMFVVDSCWKELIRIRIKGRVYLRDTNHFDSSPNGRCHDCGIVNKQGNLHHFGCDVERCPLCQGPLISCGCLDESA